MLFNEFYRLLEAQKYYVFSYGDLNSFYPKEPPNNLKKIMFRWENKGWIRRLKRGLYELTYPHDFMISDMYIANKLYSPSYVSLETALSNYSIIPEVSFAVTSITTKPTRRFKNKHGLFIYHTVKPDVFRGYFIEKHGAFDVLIAEPEKALVDYLYFKSFRAKKISLLEERFDKKVLLTLNRKKIITYARLYHLNLEDFYANL